MQIVRRNFAGVEMDLDSIYRLGLWVQRLRDIDMVLAKVKGEAALLYGLGLVNDILQGNLIGNDCIYEISQWKEKLSSKYDDKSQIDKNDAKELVRDSNRWNERLHKDLRAKHVVEMELQSGLNPDELLKLADKKSSEFIPEEVWKKLTDIEKSDFSDAARCLLLGTATPSVMVALRGAEASIRNYYHCKTTEDPGKKTWRQLTHDLKSKTTVLGIEDTFIGYLDYIGAAKRNFAQHPNKIYSLREAVVIFMQLIGLIEDVYAQI